MSHAPAGTTLVRASLLVDDRTTITDAWVLFRGDTIIAVAAELMLPPPTA